MLNFLFINKCSHSKVSVNKKCTYCPDCGELVYCDWFIIRCNCCKIKRKAIIRFGKILPYTNFCTNCGDYDFTVEKIENINFIDLKYAVYKKYVNKQTKIFKNSNLYWIEKHLTNLKFIPIIN